MPQTPLSLPDRFAVAWPPSAWSGEHLLVAVSGGGDSVALLRLLLAVRPSDAAGKITVAHFNHRLRGAESDGDEAFVAGFCGGLGVACELGRGPDRLAEAPFDRSEASARHVRYAFLQATSQRLGARYVVTGHTAEDQAETVLHNVLRGTGLAGLAGMPRVRELGPMASLVRPLLEFRRAELVDYLAAIGQEFRHDGSNDDPRYRRNRLRHEVLPLLADVQGPHVVEALNRLGRLAGEAQGAIDDCAEQCVAECVVSRGADQFVLNVAPLHARSAHLVRETLRRLWQASGWPTQAMDFGQWEALAQMVLARDARSTAAQDFPGQIHAERVGETFTLTRQ